MPNSSLNICYATDNNYVMQAGVSLLSCLENNKSIKNINIYFLDDRIGEKNKEKLDAIASMYNRKIIFIPVKQSLKIIKNLKAKQWVNNSFSTYSRIFIATLLPKNIKTVLYCDCDTIIDGNISHLVEEFDRSRVAGMVIEAGHVKIKEIIHLKSQFYYNAGVLLINLERWRKLNIQKKILQHMKEKQAYYPYVDQDILNINLAGKIDTLPLCYNVTPPYLMYNIAQLSLIYKMDTASFSCEELCRAKKTPLIIHYAGDFFGRPWETNNIHPLTKTYDKYLYHANSPWNNYKKYGRVLSVTVRAQRLLYQHLPFVIYVLIAKIAADLNAMIMQFKYSKN